MLQEKLSPIERYKILAATLGKEKHPDHVEGVGREVGIRGYFRACHGFGTMKKEEVDHILVAMRDQIVAQMENMMRRTKEEIMSIQRHVRRQLSNKPILL